MPKISFIIPCYFNEQNIPVTSAELIDNEKNFAADVAFEYIFIDDGSKDNTYSELVKFHSVYPEKVKIIKLAGNVGSYNAILAGMNYSTGDCNVIIAADLQDPLDLVPKMYDYWCKGVKFVIANRQDREESFSQKMFSNTYHYLMRKFALENIPPGGFDFVLFDKQLCKQVVEINESNTNTIYLLSWLNYDFVSIPYTRKKRQIGKSRWTLKKKVKLFVDSFVSFSYAPIRLISLIGILLGLSAFAYGIAIIIAKFTGNIPVSGWSSMMVVVLFVSAFQMTALGIIGEYVWRTNDSARKRPNYIVDKTIL
jgi:polyisoprenyl-phosphate glycosyltransferase